MTLEPGFAVRDLVVSYRSRRALDGLSLSCEAGVNGLLGPNGAGKTTLMRVLATVLAQQSGEVNLLGRDVSTRAARTEVRRQLGYLPQIFGYYPRFTVREFVHYFAWLKQVPRADIALAVDRAVERVGLMDRASSPMKSLSGGMLRRAGIAQAIVNDPLLLLLDEPTAGLDPEQRVDFRDLLRELGLDTCVLVSTHLVEDVASACTRVGLVDEGRLVFDGTPAELVALGEDNGRGDSPIERGYGAALSRSRASS